MTHKFSRVLAFVCVTALASLHTAAAELGGIPPGGFQSPEGDPRFSPEAGVKPLNNLVFELLNVDTHGSASYEFQNPREGWVHIRVSKTGGTAVTSVLLDNMPVALKSYDGHVEAMRYTAQGTHTIQLPNDAPEARLEVRAIGELVYATYGYNPHIKEAGNFSWDFLREHCLDHYNSIIGTSEVTDDAKSVHEAEILEWTSQGKRWFTSESVPYGASTVEEAFDHWANSLGMSHPLMSGIWADEFGVGEKFGKKTADMYPIWIGAIEKLHAHPAYANRIFYAYGPSRMLPPERFEQMIPFVQTLMKYDYRLGPEWYLPESYSRPGRIIEKTGDLLADFSPAWEQDSRASFERMCQGAAANRVVVVSLLSEPGWESGDLFPHYDFNVFLDCQLQFIATDPAFFAIRGLQGYLSGYCNEEHVRLFAKLIRHYAIEGNTNRFLDDPYVLTHLQNADLADGTAGWSLEPASEDSIAIKTVPGFGTLQGKFHAPEGTGDVVFWTRRDANQPNVITQSIRNLTPGRLYSLRMITADYQEFLRGESVPNRHAITIAIDDVDRIQNKCFQALVPSGHWYSYGPFNAQKPYWINYHQIVFRAKASNSTLRLSDCLSPESSGGEPGRELMWTFFQIQPYFE